jgi:uncharacterized protein DUF4232
VRRALVCLAGMTGLAGCGSTSAPSSTTTSTPTTTSTSTTTITTTRSGTTSGNTGAATAQAAGAGCSARQITLSVAPGGAGLSHVGVVLRFRNTGASACILTGYPGATLVTAGGLLVPARRTRAGYLGGLPSSTGAIPVLHLVSGASASALLEGLDADVAHGGGPCPRYAHLLVTAPNQRLTVRFPTPLQQVCAPEVHPVVAGMSGRAAS